VTSIVASMTDIVSPFPDLDDQFVRALPELTLAWEPQTVPAPAMLALNQKLAEELGLDPDALQSPEGVAFLSGAATPAGANPVAMGYAGHQFGNYSPRLGDGRAALLGELTDTAGNRVDLQLKGSGRTLFSRGGDGKASVGPMLREFLFAEAMHALGIPTTRALAVVTTGEPVMRQSPEPGAVLTRTAASHLRVGSFEYAVRMEDKSVLVRLADLAIDRHYPALADSEEPYLGLLEAVRDAQAELVSSWMLIGFIHGVLNTDNVLISGETIDYGPCAFMDRFDQATVFSSIDHAGRYAFGNQPSITLWNLTRLAETLIPLIDEDADAAVEKVNNVLDGYGAKFMASWHSGMRSKLGLASATEGDEALFDQLLGLLQTNRVDFTSAFRALAAWLRDSPEPLDLLFADADVAERDTWLDAWTAALDAAGSSADRATVADGMDLVNPIYIARNHLVDEALRAAESGDTEPFHELLDVLLQPFTKRAGLERFAQPAPDDFNRSFQTFCGT